MNFLAEYEKKKKSYNSKAEKKNKINKAYINAL